MKFSIIDNNNFKVYVNTMYMEFNYEDDDELYESLKKVLINIRKKYAYNIYGFYEVNIYNIKEIATILYFRKEDDEDFVYKTVDLKIIRNPLDNVYLKFEDYYLIENYKSIKYFENNYYIKASELKERDINRLVEHFEIVIDERLNDISCI